MFGKIVPCEQGPALARHLHYGFVPMSLHQWQKTQCTTPQNLELTKDEGIQLSAILRKIKINSSGEYPNVLKRNCGSRPKIPSEKMERWQSLVERAQTSTIITGIKEQTHTSDELPRNLILGWFPQIFVPNCLSRSKAQSLKISHAIMHRQMFVSVAAVHWKETALKICVICSVLAATSDNSSAAVSDGF